MIKVVTVNAMVFHAKSLRETDEEPEYDKTMFSFCLKFDVASLHQKS